MNLQQFISTFVLIFVAELPDKTFFATLLMASRGRPAPIFFGVALAFLVQCFVAVTGGRLLSAFPQMWLHLVAGLMFLVFAVFSWRGRHDHLPNNEEGAPQIPKIQSFARALWGAFLVIFIAEWGDTTQLASASLVAQGQNPWTVFTASVLALWVVTGLAVTVGARTKDHLPVGLLKRVAAVLFSGFGFYFLWSWAKDLFVLNH